MQTKNLPPIQPRSEAVVVYKRDQVRRKGLIPALLARLFPNLLGGGAGTSAVTFGTAAGTGANSFFGVLSTQGLLAALASSKAAFFSVVMAVVGTAITIGVIATNFKSIMASAKKAPAALNAPKKDAPKLSALRSSGSDPRGVATPGGISSLNYLVGAAKEEAAAAEAEAAVSAMDAPAGIKEGSAPKTPEKHAPASAKASAKAQISAMKGSVSPTLAKDPGGKGASTASGKIGGRYGADVTKKGTGPGPSDRNGPRVGMRPPVRKGSLKSGGFQPLSSNSVMKQLYSARNDNIGALRSSTQGTSQAAGAAYDGGSRAKMLGSARPGTSNGNLDSKSISVTPPEAPPTPPPPVGKGENKTPYQMQLLMALGSFLLSLALKAMAQAQRASPDPATQSQANKTDQEAATAKGVGDGLGQEISSMDQGMNNAVNIDNVGQSTAPTEQGGFEMPPLPQIPPPPPSNDKEDTPKPPEKPKEPEPINVTKIDNGLGPGGGGSSAGGLQMEGAPSGTIGGNNGGVVSDGSGGTQNVVV